MQVLITHTHSPRTHVLHFSRLQMALATAALVLVLMLLSGAIYHFVFLKAAREGWPVVSQIVRLVVRDEIAQRDRVMRDNLDAMAQRVGELQAKVVKLEAMGDKVMGLAGVKAEELKPLVRSDTGGKGGPFVALEHPTLEQLSQVLQGLDQQTDLRLDVFTLIESRLFERRLSALMVPTTLPVDGPVGSGYGFRPDPFTSRAALHTGLDFPADIGTAVKAAAGGLVVAAQWHAAYGQVLEIDHGNNLITRYAHLHKTLVAQGDLVKRGQVVGQVGNTGRSTGPHLHFEVLVDGVTQDPARFLFAPQTRPAAQAGAAQRPR